MITEHLDEETAAIVESIGAQQFKDGESFIRFWDRKCVQLDGDFSLEDLKTLVEIMAAIKPKGR